MVEEFINGLVEIPQRELSEPSKEVANQCSTAKTTRKCVALADVDVNCNPEDKPPEKPKERKMSKKTNKQRLFLSSSFSSNPQIYGLPKIHKEGIPLRPIVSVIGSPTHRLARELVRILSPLEGTTDSHVKNSTDFVNRIGQLTIQESDIMASFDTMTACPSSAKLSIIF